MRKKWNDTCSETGMGYTIRTTALGAGKGDSIQVSMANQRPLTSGNLIWLCEKPGDNWWRT